MLSYSWLSVRPLVSFALAGLLFVGCSPCTKDPTAEGCQQLPTPGPAPCSDDTWGAIPTDLGDVVFVSPNGGPNGDGSLSKPLGTFVDALAAVGSDPERSVVGLLEGTYTEKLNLIGSLPGLTLDGVTVAGCSSNSVTLEAPVSTESVVEVNGVFGVQLAGFTARGGTRTLLIFNGAGWDPIADAADPIVLTDLIVDQGNRVAVVVDSFNTSVEMNNITVTDPVPVSDIFSQGNGVTGYGWGISVQAYGQAIIRDSLISGATEVGIFGSFAAVTVQDTSISDVVANALNLAGRGIHLQSLSTGQFTSNQISGVEDAGIFVRKSVGVEIDGNTVNSVSGAAIDQDGVDETGDGIVVTLGDSNLDPSSFAAMITNNSITGASRVDILIDGIDATVSGNTAAGQGIFSQGNGVVVGTDPVTQAPNSYSLNFNSINPVDTP